MSFRTLCCVALASLLLGLAPQAWAQAAAHQQTVAAAAARAQTQCFRLMYRDTNGYAQCIRDLRRAQAGSPWDQLGTEYFGFVGALSYMRVGHLNAEQIASEFLKDFRLTQRRLGMAEAALCNTVPGDCTVRMAQTRAMQAAPAPQARSLRMQCLDRICQLVPTP